MKLEWAGQSRDDDDAGQLEPTRLINCYRVVNGDALYIRSVLGMTQIEALEEVFLRVMAELDGVLHVVHAGKLATVNGGVTTLATGINDDAQTTIAGNNGDITIAAGGEYYVWDGTTLTTPATGAFSSVGSVDFFEQKTIITEKDGRRVSWSALADATDFDALDFATAEARDDKIIRGLAVGGTFWVFKEQSIEIWANDGAGGLSVLPGQVIDRGIKAFSLLTRVPGGAFFIGDDGVAYLGGGTDITPISTQAVSSAIRNGSPTHCFYYEDEGQKIVVIRFNDRASWCCDLSTREWHERAQGPTLAPWDVIAAARAGGEQYVGTINSRVCRMDRSNRDFGGALVRRMVSRTLDADGKRFRVNRVHLVPRVGWSDIGADAGSVIGTGTGDATGVGDGSAVGENAIDPDAAPSYLQYRVSRTRGKTWGTENWRSLGKLGDFLRSVTLRNLGVTRAFNLELTLADPVEVPMSAIASVDITAGVS